MKAPLPFADVLGHEASDKRIDILHRLDQVGSISQAARAAGVSYKAAWQALETLTNLAGTPLVERAVGGSGGGGAVLTAAGHAVLQAANAMRQARQHALQQLQASGTDRAAMALRTSMRNQLRARVLRTQPFQGQVRVHLQLPGGQSLRARITRESAQLLGLRAQLEVLVLCKATAVSVVAQAPEDAAVNQLSGRVLRASRAVAGGEVSLDLSAHIHMVGFAAAGHGLKVGHAATALVDEASIVIAQLD